jgi:hypothetical protein
MPTKLIGPRPMTPAERQQRRRDKLAIERRLAQAAQPLSYPPELDQRRRSIGLAARYLAAQGDPAMLARALVMSGAPLPPPSVLKAAASWLAEFTEALRVAAALAGSPVLGDAAQASGTAAPCGPSRADLADIGS